MDESDRGLTMVGAYSRKKRRYWSDEAKRRLVELSSKPNFSIAETARCYGVNANQLHTWRREFGASGAPDPVALKPTGPAPLMTFAQVDIVEARPQRPEARLSERSAITVEMACGARIYVGDDAAEETLRRVVCALRLRT